MAKSNIFVTAALFFVLATIMISPAVAHEKKHKKHHHPAIATRKDYKIWQKCSHKLTPWCGHEIVDGIIEHGKVDNKCCRQFIRMGQHCVKTMQKLLLSENFFRLQRPKIPKKTTEVWQNCIDHLKKKKKKKKTSKHGIGAAKKQLISSTAL